jgi:hypothetical protein
MISMVQDSCANQTTGLSHSRKARMNRKNPHFAGLEFPSFVWLC